ncbi:hypothetical protein F5Y02DRAFT_418356 [Annulohypoxylon stygium]|nr:hypothetical protein F5Y02DRAFT_418356 [Annulohypoxylon stygium]
MKASMSLVSILLCLAGVHAGVVERDAPLNNLEARQVVGACSECPNPDCCTQFRSTAYAMENRSFCWDHSQPPPEEQLRRRQAAQEALSKPKETREEKKARIKAEKKQKKVDARENKSAKETEKPMESEDAAEEAESDKE